MLLESYFQNLALEVEPFAVCCLSSGWRLKLPAPEWVTLHFVLKGEARLTVPGGSNRTMGPQTLAVVPPGMAHGLECGAPIEHEAAPTGNERSPCSLTQLSALEDATDFRAACGRVHVTLGGSLGLFDLMRDPEVLDFSDEARMGRIFDDLISEEQNESPGSRAMIAALMNQCLVSIFRRLGDSHDEQLPWLVAFEDPGIAPAMERVLAKPGDPHSLESLAEHAGMSRSTFADRFARGTGRTPMDFVREVRIREAAKLLRQHDLSIDTVADRVGFASRSHFSRAFKGYFHQTPTEFRKGGTTSNATTD